MNGWVKKWTEKVYIKKDIKYLQFAFQNSLNEDNDVFTPMKKVLGVKTKKKKTFSSPQGPGSPPPPPNDTVSTTRYVSVSLDMD